MIQHELRADPAPFAAILRGEKTAEFRLDDRGFEVGHFLLLHDYVRPLGKYLGSEIRLRVTHVLRDAEYGMPTGYAMLSFRLETDEESAAWWLVSKGVVVERIEEAAYDWDGRGSLWSFHSEKAGVIGQARGDTLMDLARGMGWRSVPI